MSNNLIDNPLSKEPDGTTDLPDEVKAICNGFMDIHQSKIYGKQRLIADKIPINN